MMRKEMTCAVLWIIGQSNAWAEDLHEYLSQAEKDNLMIQAELQQIEAMKERAGQISLPDPMVNVGLFVQPVETRVGPQQAKIGVQQRLPWFGTIAAQKVLADSQTSIQYQTYRVAVNQLHLQLKQLWYPMIALQQQIELMEANLKILETYHTLAIQRMESGQGNMVDMIRAEIRSETVKTEVRIAQDRLASMRAQFNLLCNAPKEREIILPQTFGVPIEQGVDYTHPRIEQFQLEQHRIQLHRELIAKQRMPSVALGVDYVMIGHADMTVLNSGQDALMPMVGVQLPIHQEKYRARLRELEHIENSLMYSEQSFLQGLDALVVESNLTIARVAHLNSLYADQIQQIQQSIDIVMVDYSTSGQEFEHLLQLQQELLQLQIANVELEESFWMAQAQLDAIMEIEDAQ